MQRVDVFGQRFVLNLMQTITMENIRHVERNDDIICFD